MGDDRSGSAATRNQRRAAIAIASVVVAAVSLLSAAAPASAHGGSPSFNLNHFSNPAAPTYRPHMYWPHVQGALKTQNQLALEQTASSELRSRASLRAGHHSARMVRYASNRALRAVIAYFVLYAGR